MTDGLPNPTALDGPTIRAWFQTLFALALGEAAQDAFKDELFRAAWCPRPSAHKRQQIEAFLRRLANQIGDPEVTVSREDLHYALVQYGYRIQAVEKTQRDADPITVEDVARYSRLAERLEGSRQ